MSSASGESTPNARFISQAASAEELLKEQTLGLMHLADFRKRKADAFEQSAQDDSTEQEREPGVKTAAFKKKKKKGLKQGGLSFGDDEVDNTAPSRISAATTRLPTSAEINAPANGSDSTPPKNKLKPNTGLAFVPKSQSKAALARETQMKEVLRKQYMEIQESVRATEFILPFVFFDGKDTVGGKVRMKKGDPIWLFLERARKVGAESATRHSGSRKDWARISVDDLMFVRQDLIIPQHFDFYHFILNNSTGYDGPLFSLSSKPSIATPSALSDSLALTSGSGPLLPTRSTMPDQDLEGSMDDPALTKVVDRRWYEKNKHIYPASLWEDFDAQRDYSQGGRKDREGNQMFFAR